MWSYKYDDIVESCCEKQNFHVLIMLLVANCAPPQPPPLPTPLPPIPLPLPPPPPPPPTPPPTRPLGGGRGKNRATSSVPAGPAHGRERIIENLQCTEHACAGACMGAWMRVFALSRACVCVSMRSCVQLLTYACHTLYESASCYDNVMFCVMFLHCCGHQACIYVRCLHESHVSKIIIIIIHVIYITLHVCYKIALFWRIVFVHVTVVLPKLYWNTMTSRSMVLCWNEFLVHDELTITELMLCHNMRTPRHAHVYSRMYAAGQGGLLVVSGRNRFGPTSRNHRSRWQLIRPTRLYLDGYNNV